MRFNRSCLHASVRIRCEPCQPGSTTPGGEGTRERDIERPLLAADHRRFTVATDIEVYFSDPHNPWQRGSNENTNGLLRQYFPKGIDLFVYSQAKLNAVARRLNERPRKTLNFDTPAERFHQSVASTG